MESRNFAKKISQLFFGGSRLNNCSVYLIFETFKRLNISEQYMDQ